jgi:HPt (histidine-containing phosphotransfer) domain-containing protein
MTISNLLPQFSDSIRVERSVSELIPQFLKNKLVDLELIHSMIEKNDLVGIQRIGHNWKGSCSTYGFHYLSHVGEQFEKVSNSVELNSLIELIDTIPIYLKNIEVIITPN